MRPVIIISCMHQSDHFILRRSNVRCDCVVVNQCDTDRIDEFDFTDEAGATHRCIFANTTERGLSRSRNMAMRLAPEDAICLIADDDELFADNLKQILVEAWEKHPDAGAVTFALTRKDLPPDEEKTYSETPFLMGFTDILRCSSLQISFRKETVKKAGISFDEKMGSGTGNGGGEENKFLLDLRRRKLPLFYEPEVIATVLPGESQWFHGYDRKYLENLGWASRRSMGTLTGFLYINYWVLSHKALYSPEISIPGAMKYMWYGYFSKR